MKSNFKNYEELAHYWAHTDCTHYGKTYCGRMFFSGDKIYSYGYHFVIAEKIRDKKGNVVFVAFNANDYSNTTSKHKWIVRRALFQDIVQIPKADAYDSAKFAEYCVTTAKNALVSEGRARKEHTKSQYKAEAANAISNWHTYCLFMKQAGKKICKLTKAQKLVLGSLNVDLEAVREAEVRAIKAAIEKKRKEAKILHKQEVKYLEMWKNGEIDNLPYLQTITDTVLRIKDGNVETSRHAQVSCKSAKVLWEMIREGRDVKGKTVDNYTVISMNGVLKIGCHVIDRAEVERIGKQLENQ